MIKTNIGIFQTRQLPPKVDGKNSGTHYRFLFREQKDPSHQHQTIQIFIDEDQIGSVIEQSLEVLPKEIAENICQNYLDELDSQAA